MSKSNNKMLTRKIKSIRTQPEQYRDNKDCVHLSLAVNCIFTQELLLHLLLYDQEANRRGEEQQ